MSEVSSYIQPDWLIPLSSAPLRYPVVCQRTGLAVSNDLARSLSSASIERLPNSIIMPAFVNAHTHLDLSGFEKPVGQQGMRFADWLIQIIGHRRLESKLPQDSMPETIRRGLSECIASGVSMVGNISGWPWKFTNYPASEIKVVDFLEQLGANTDLAAERNARLEEFLDRTSERLDHRSYPGISPHAPYSTSAKLFDMAIELARKRNLPVAMHLAESFEERVFLDSGSGPFLEVLKSAGVDASKTGFPSIEHCLGQLARCKTALVVHGNFLSDRELDIIAANASHVSVVWCPRTHAWFCHSPWPLKRMLDRGICVAIGTDSRASNPDLDLLGEVRAIAEAQPTLDPRTILKLATLNGVQALFGNAATQTAPSILLQYAEEIPGNPECAVLSLEPLSRKPFPVANQVCAD